MWYSLLQFPCYTFLLNYKANRFQAQYHSNYNISYMCHKYAILNAVDFSAIQTYNRLWINLCTHKMTLKLLSVPSGQPCLLRSGAVFLFSFHGLLSYPDFFGIMTFYQECCICAISSKKGRDNMGDFSSIYKFF